jgi:hypothetical protein
MANLMVLERCGLFIIPMKDKKHSFIKSRILEIDLKSMKISNARGALLRGQPIVFKQKWKENIFLVKREDNTVFGDDLFMVKVADDVIKYIHGQPLKRTAAFWMTSRGLPIYAYKNDCGNLMLLTNGTAYTTPAFCHL